MKVPRTLQAEQDRVEIVEYIAEENLCAAARMVSLFSAAVARLADFPEQ